MTPEGGCVASRGGIQQACCSTDPMRPCFPTGPGTIGKLERIGAAIPPTPAWPLPTYPKTATGARLVATFCISSAGSSFIEASSDGPGALIPSGHRGMDAVRTGMNDALLDHHLLDLPTSCGRVKSRWAYQSPNFVEGGAEAVSSVVPSRFRSLVVHRTVNMRLPWAHRCPSARARLGTQRRVRSPPMAVRPFDPATQQVPLKGLLDRMFKTRWGTWVAINIGQRIDPYLMRATRGRIRISITAPTILLTHTGAKSGTRRTTPLLYFTEGPNVVLIASKGGAPQNPAWYHNVKVYPEVEASTDGRPERYVAREAEGAERERLWKLATKLYSGYEDYQARAINRRIPVIVLEPAER